MTSEEELPTQVTDANWDDLQREGFVFVTNSGWPLSMVEGDGYFSDEEFVRNLRMYYVEVLLGYPMNKSDRPDRNFGSGRTVGVYVKR